MLPAGKAILEIALSEAGNLYEEAKQASIETTKEQLVQSITSKRTWAGNGNGDGTIWHSTLEASSSLDDCVKLANATIVAKGCKAFSASSAALVKELSAYTSACAFFEHRVDPDTIRAGEEVWERLTTSYYEGLLVAALGQKLKPMDLRDKVWAISKRWGPNMFTSRRWGATTSRRIQRPEQRLRSCCGSESRWQLGERPRLPHGLSSRILVAEQGWFSRKPPSAFNCARGLGDELAKYGGKHLISTCARAPSSSLSSCAWHPFHFRSCISAISRHVVDSLV